MIKIDLIKKATQAKTLLPDSIDFIDVSTDSRSIGPGTLFVALRGEKFDGHDYVAAALEKGATAALVDHNPGVAPQKCILVPDTLKACLLYTSDAADE